MIGEYKSNVVLPEHFWEEAKDNEHLKKLVLQSMQKCYPYYTVKKIKDGMAICERE